MLGALMSVLHLCEDELRAYCRGDVTTHTLNAVEHHIFECAECALAVARIVRSDWEQRRAANA